MGEGTPQLYCITIFITSFTYMFLLLPSCAYLPTTYIQLFARAITVFYWLCAFLLPHFPIYSYYYLMDSSVLTYSDSYVVGGISYMVALVTVSGLRLMPPLCCWIMDLFLPSRFIVTARIPSFDQFLFFLLVCCCFWIFHCSGWLIPMFCTIFCSPHYFSCSFRNGVCIPLPSLSVVWWGVFNCWNKHTRAPYIFLFASSGIFFAFSTGSFLPFFFYFL